jgi:hypothetical protein
VGDRVHDDLPHLSVLRRLGNPLTSEAAAFRWLLAVVALAAVVVLLVLGIRAVA